MIQILAAILATSASTAALASDFTPEMPQARFQSSSQNPIKSFPIWPNTLPPSAQLLVDDDFGLCRVEQFEVILEGWTRESDVSKPSEPCQLAPTDPQPEICPTAPCVNTACHALMHYRAVVELSPGQDMLWPACYFKQQRMGYRSYKDYPRGGTQTFVQFEPGPTYDYAGAIGPGTSRYRREAVPGKLNHYVFHFYDTPGWRRYYEDGRPNALSTKWFPFDWHYMYRAYLGPKRKDLVDEDYLYMRIDMTARVEPALGIDHDQALGTPQTWKDYNKKLEALRGKPGP